MIRIKTTSTVFNFRKKIDVKYFRKFVAFDKKKTI